MRRACVIAGVLVMAGAPPATPAAAAERPADGTPVAWVGRFDRDDGQWREIPVRADLPRNRFRRIVWDGVQALEVQSAASMSLMGRPLAIDLEATPVLCWRWRVDASIAGADMTRRAGDDYAARVYVSFRLPATSMSLALRARLGLARTIWGPELPDAAVNYVWDNRHPPGTEQANAYTDRAMMVVLRTGDAEAGAWVTERRDVHADVTRLFGAGARAVQLAVAADTDNTGGTARAGFADFHFVPRDRPCQRPG